MPDTQLVSLTRDGDVFVLRLDAGENRFNAAVLDAVGRALDEVEAAPAPAALVVTGTGKFFTNGLDLDEMSAAGPAGAEAYVARVLATLGRVLTLPVSTVAAVNGHAFGAGALLALVTDFAVMRADRGFFCMPEIDMKFPLHPGMVAILQARLPLRTAHEVIMTGKRFGGPEAALRHIVHEAVAEDRVVPRAVELAAALASKADQAVRILRSSLYPGVLDALSRPLSSVPGLKRG
jgi:enoyl-CoA hydratase/carnithine racemase